MILLFSIPVTFILMFLINKFFLKEKHRNWLMKHSSWSILPVWLCLVPILIFDSAFIKNAFIFLQWCFLMPQMFGVYFQQKQHRKQLKELSDKMIVWYEDTITDAKKAGLSDDHEMILDFRKNIDEIKNPPTFKTKFLNLFKKNK